MKGCDILVVEDDPRIQELILQSLSDLNLRIIAEKNGTAGEARAREYLPAVIVLDLGLPGLSGIDLLRRLQSWFKGSVIVVTAWEDETNKLEAFELGADDYVQKPFSPKELLARVKVALKRTHPPKDPDTDKTVLHVGDLTINPSEHQATVLSKPISLTQTEFKFLRMLASEPGHLISQKRLLEEIWGPNHSQDTHYLRILVSRLRRKLSENQSQVELVTESGLGYRLNADS